MLSWTCAALMGTNQRAGKDDKCLLWNFGTRRDGGATWRVSYSIMHVYVCACICMYVHVFACMCMNLLVCVCICLYVYVSACIYMYEYVSACMCMYLHVYDHWFCCQRGLFPPSVADYAHHPLTCGKSLAPSVRIESFHMAVGLLRCFDASLNNEEQKIHMTWFPKDNRFMQGAKKVPPYTPLFWAIFFKMVNCLGSYKTPILTVSLHVYSCICMYLIVCACI